MEETLKEALFTTREAAEYCKMSFDNFRFYIRTGRIKPDVGNRRLLIWRQSTLDEFLNSPKREKGWPKDLHKKSATVEVK